MKFFQKSAQKTLQTAGSIIPRPESPQATKRRGAGLLGAVALSGLALLGASNERVVDTVSETITTTHDRLTQESPEQIDEFDSDAVRTELQDQEAALNARDEEARLNDPATVPPVQLENEAVTPNE